MTRLPIQLVEWATLHGVSAAAIDDLYRRLLPAPPAPIRDPKHTSEAYVQSLVRLEAPRYDTWLGRNNVGVLTDITGRPVRYGLANETPAQNKILKSADTLGWKRRLIQPQDVGTVIAQTVSRECKRPDWVWRGTDREQAQLNWALLVSAAGGDAAIVTGEGSFK